MAILCNLQIDATVSSYFETIQFILQPSSQEHCKNIKWRQVVQIHPVVMHGHAPSQREGEEITDTIAIVLLVYVMLVLI